MWPASGRCRSRAITKASDAISVCNVSRPISPLRPANDPASAHVEDRRQVKPTLPGRNIGEIGEPDLVGLLRGEVAREPVRGDGIVMAAVRCSGAARQCGKPAQSSSTHQDLNAVAAHRLAGAAQDSMDARRP
jgi:hypothetical protein